MATIEINTQSAGYQNRLTALTEIIQFYKPVIDAYLEISDPGLQRRWRQADPMLKKLLSIWYYINNQDDA